MSQPSLLLVLSGSSVWPPQRGVWGSWFSLDHSPVPDTAMAVARRRLMVGTHSVPFLCSQLPGLHGLVCLVLHHPLAQTDLLT